MTSAQLGVIATVIKVAATGVWVVDATRSATCW
jgi:hypothetical protein